MAENKRTQKKKKKGKKLKIFLLILFLLIVTAIGAVGGIVIAIAKDAPKIDPTNIDSILSQTSFILDPEGNEIEKIQTQEYRTVVDLDKIPKNLQNAFIAIEDERFRSHIGIDPKGIVKSTIDNIRAGAIVRGASTITQQLARNLYLNNDVKWDRKIKEAYLALQIEKVLTKDQILEAYLNRIYLGQGAYGVQGAAQTYFSKNVEDLTLAQCALIAGVVKSPYKYPPYKTVKPENFDSSTQYEVGELDILGEKYIAVYNEDAVERQKIVLMKMKELGYISEEEYQEALKEDIKTELKPGRKKITGISSYFTDYVKSQVIDALVNELGYSREDAENELFTGGLRIYSTMDVDMQHKLEEIYKNFTEELFNVKSAKAPILIDWKLDKNKNILGENNNIIYYKQENLFNKNYDLIVEKGTFELGDTGLKINNKKFSVYNNSITISDYYNINEKKNLVTHNVGALSVPEKSLTKGDNKEFLISKEFLNENKDFYSIDEKGNLLINSKYFFRSSDGVVQPQSATVILDYRTGEIKALVGGRDIEGAKLLNRATSSRRQPGSSIKPIAVYLPALDNGYTAATPIDDVPYYDHNGNIWPRNSYKGYKGITTLRASVEQSINVNSVKTLSDIGIKTSMEYLTKLGIINSDDPKNDSFVSSAENKKNNDENLSALGLGGMTKGLTPLELTAAYGAIADGGTYTKPLSFTKILDKDGNVLIENTPQRNKVVSEGVAFVMSDILRTTVTNGIAGRAQIPNMPTAGKTGTTQNQADIWFVGFTPYYAAGVWIGNDSPQITLTKGSSMAATLWQKIMTDVHEGLEKKNFEKPDSIVTAQICTQSGKLPTSLCARDPRGSTVRSEIFVKGTVPTEQCDVHVELDIDTVTNKIANKYCPPGNVEKRVFIKRNPPYKPAEHGGILPNDYKYTAPTEVCDVHNQENSVNDWLNDWFNNGNDNNDNGNDDNNGNENNNNGNNENNNGNGNDDNNNWNDDDNNGNNGNNNGNTDQNNVSP